MEKWTNKGLLIRPSKKIWWMYSHVGACCAEKINKNLIRLYISGRGKDNKSRIGTAIIKWSDKPTVMKISKNPIINIPNLKAGYFHTDGALYPEITKFKGKTFLYFCGWLNYKTFKYNCNIGLALKKSGNFKLYSKAPIFKLDDIDPIGTGSMSVFKKKNYLLMYYVSFDEWVKKGGKFQHKYYIKIAKSFDGINWIKKNQIAVKIKNSEIAVSKPSVISEGKKISMYFSARGKYYKIFKVSSKDGLKFGKRSAEIIKKSGSWDSKSREYPCVIRLNKKTIMFFNGNNFGKTGLGYAIKD